MVLICPKCGRWVAPDEAFCQVCGADLTSSARYRTQAEPGPEPQKRSDNSLVVVLVVLLVVVVLVAGALFFAYIGAKSDDSEVGSCSLTITVSNSSIYLDREYSIYIDGQWDRDDVALAGYVATLTYDMSWTGPAPVRNISVVWAGGSESQSVQLVADSVVGVSFTI